MRGGTKYSYSNVWYYKVYLHKIALALASQINLTQVWPLVNLYMESPYCCAHNVPFFRVCVCLHICLRTHQHAKYHYCPPSPH